MNPTSKLIEPWIDAIKRAAGKQDIDPYLLAAIGAILNGRGAGQ